MKVKVFAFSVMLLAASSMAEDLDPKIKLAQPLITNLGIALQWLEMKQAPCKEISAFTQGPMHMWLLICDKGENIYKLERDILGRTYLERFEH